MITRYPKLTRQPAWRFDKSKAEANLPMPRSHPGLEYHRSVRYQLRYLTWLLQETYPDDTARLADFLEELLLH